MAWIKNNERRPICSGYFQTKDSVGRISGTSFHMGQWYSHTGHPVDEWFDRDEEVSNCCGAKIYTEDFDSFICMDCKEPCERVNLSEEEKQ